MLKYYLKIALRNFQTNKVIFAGSLLTLCLGALCISLLFSYVHSQLTMNNFSRKSLVENSQGIEISTNNRDIQEDIYMIIDRATSESQWWGCDVSKRIKLDYRKHPELESLVNIKRAKRNYKIRYNSSIYNSSGLVVDSTFFKVLPFEVNSLDPKNILKDPNTILLSQSFSKKLFGKKSPIGKSISIERSLRPIKSYTISGIVKIPSNSSIQFDFLIPMTYGWLDFVEFGSNFIRTKKGFDRDDFVLKINRAEKFNPYFKDYELDIVNLNEIYFNRDLDINSWDIFSQFGDRKNIEIMMVIMLVILVISVLNFSNLQIISINDSLKKIGINKINGAKKSHLVLQKITEVSLLIIISSIVLSIAHQLVLPYFNTFFEVRLAPPLLKIIFINAAILLLLVVTSLIYPLIVISKISIVNSLKKQHFAKSHFNGRKVVAIFQYSLTIIVLISSIIVAKQLDLLLSKDLGIQSENIISTQIYYYPNDASSRRKLPENEQEERKRGTNESYEFIKNELLSHSSILNISQGTSPIDPRKSVTYKIKEYGDDFKALNTLYISPNHKDLFDFHIIEGRFFKELSVKPQQRSSPDNKVVINEAAKKYWNIDDISKVTLVSSFGGFTEIIGVVKDFNYEHLSAKPKPLVMYSNYAAHSNFFIQFKEGAVQSGLKFVEELFKEVNPDEIFTYSFMSNEIAALYQKEKRLRNIYILFTIIALLISAIGLFTIAMYDTQRRTKEIGIRKVNGAKIKEIMIMLNKDFVIWVLIAIVIACPVAYYAMSKWLENFAYKTSLSWWVFALAGVFTLVIALLTVSRQSYRAASRNPIEALRDE